MTGTELEKLVVRITGDPAEYLKALGDAQAKTLEAANHIESAAERIEGFMGSIKGFAASAVTSLLEVVGVGGALAAVFKGINLAAEAEKNTVAFGTMLGSMEDGKRLVQDLQQFAAATPLNTPDIQQAAKTLLQFGTAADDLLPLLKQLGDVTGGDAQRFNQMALAFGQASASGRLMGQDLLQMINAGFNPLKEISRTTGKSMAQLKEDMEKGRISVNDLKAAFQSATGPGGQFFDLMSKQSRTLSGLFSTMQDDIGAALRTLGESAAEGLKLRDAMIAVSNAAKSLMTVLQENGPQVAIFIKAVGALAGIAAVGGALAGLNAGIVAVATSAASATVAVGAFVAASWPILLAAAGAAAAIKGLVDMEDALTGRSERAAEAMREIDARAGAAADALDRIFSKKVQAVIDIEKPEERQQAARDALKEVNNELKGAQELLKSAREDVMRLGTKQARSDLATAQAQVDILAQKQAQFKKLAEDSADAKFEVTKAQEKLAEDSDKLIAKLREEVAVWGLTRDAAEIAKAEFDGMSEATLDQIRALQAQRRELEDGQRELDDYLKLVDEGQKLTKEMRSPWEKYADEIERLNALLDAGVIDEGTYGAAVEKAEAALDRAGQAAKRAKQEVQQFDAALVGSAEAATRIQQYQDMLRGVRGGDGAAMGRQMGQAAARGQQQPTPPPAQDVGHQRRTEDLLQKILLELQNLNRKGSPVLKPAAALR